MSANSMAGKDINFMYNIQELLNKELADLSHQYLQELIAKKLAAEGIATTDALTRELAEYVLSGNTKPFNGKETKHPKNATITITANDITEIEHTLNSFIETKLHHVLFEVANSISKILLKDLKSRWKKEHLLQQKDFSKFRKHLEKRWGKPIGQLRMLLTMAREWGQVNYDRENRPAKGHKIRDILLRLHVRACQVTDEIICLLENGFADGAMARWRTLHEIGVVATVISLHGESIAERYVAHQAVESKQALDKYMTCFEDLGYKTPPEKEQKKIIKAYEEAIALYGKSFKGPYGWAAEHLKNERPTFANLEVEAGRAEMRAHGQMANDNIHAGIKSLFIRLGLLEDYTGLLAGRSNAGLMEPGQNAAHTLTQISLLVCMSETHFDDIVIAQSMRSLRDEIPQSFFFVDEKLRKDDEKCKKASNK